MNPRIVLYNPQTEFQTMPLALLCLASAIDRARFEPVIIDGRMEKDPEGAVLEHCDDALCVGVTVLNGAPIKDALEVSRAVKARFPDTPVIWGGWHPSVLPATCLEEPSVDVVVKGQREPILNDIVHQLAEGEFPEDCDGCATRGQRGEIRCRPPRALIDPGSFPPLDYGLIDVEGYFDRKGRRQIDSISSIGSRQRCSFRADPTVYGRQWAGLDPDRIGNDMMRLWRRWRFEDVSFQDESFLTDKGRVVGMANRFLELDLGCTWTATLRADQGARLPKGVLELCARSGLRRVNVGVETATREGLEMLRKDTTLDQVKLSAERLARHGIAAKSSFMVGLPDESISSVPAAMDLAAELRAIDHGFETPFFFHSPCPGTELGEAIKERGHRTPSSLAEWSDFDSVGSAGPWVSDEVRRLVAPHTLSKTS